MTSEHMLPEQTAGLVSRVLLATPVDLLSDGIGALFLRDLIALQPDFAFTIHQERPFLMGGGTRLLRPLVHLFRVAAARARWLQSARLLWFRAFLVPRRAATIAATADAAKADFIWITASSVEMIWIAERLAATGWDLRVTVFDAPEYLSGNLRLSAALHGVLMRSFGTLLSQARAVSVIGHSMQEDYRERYGVESEIIRHGIDTNLSFAAREHGERNDIRIVFAGSLYSREEWNSFIQALEKAGWRVGGRSVSLHFMGRFPLLAARKPKEVILIGEKSFEEALRIMSTMDIGYLPYWFDERRKLVARTSFPGKLSAYATAGLAVFHHAPRYTEVTEFLNQHPFGFACPSLQADEIIETLGRLAEYAVTDDCRAARQVAVRDELSRAAMSSRFRRFLTRV